MAAVHCTWARRTWSRSTTASWRKRIKVCWRHSVQGLTRFAVRSSWHRDCLACFSQCSCLQGPIEILSQDTVTDNQENHPGLHSVADNGLMELLASILQGHAVCPSQWSHV